MASVQVCPHCNSKLQKSAARIDNCRDCNRKSSAFMECNPCNYARCMNCVRGVAPIGTQAPPPPASTFKAPSAPVPPPTKATTSDPSEMDLQAILRSLEEDPDVKRLEAEKQAKTSSVPAPPAPIKPAAQSTPPPPPSAKSGGGPPPPPSGSSGPPPPPGKVSKKWGAVDTGPAPRTHSEQGNEFLRDIGASLGQTQLNNKFGAGEVELWVDADKILSHSSLKHSSFKLEEFKPPLNYVCTGLLAESLKTFEKNDFKSKVKTIKITSTSESKTFVDAQFSYDAATKMLTIAFDLTRLHYNTNLDRIDKWPAAIKGVLGGQGQPVRQAIPQVVLKAGFQHCPRCSGRGKNYVEYTDGTRTELCVICEGEGQHKTGSKPWLY